MAYDINLTPTASCFQIAVSGREMSGRTWGTASECKAAALLVHGLGGHSGWFEALGRRLKVRRVYAMAYDQVGFGKRRGQQFLNYRQWLEEITVMTDHLRSQVGDVPVYIMGNSMGAVVAMGGASISRPDGLVLFSPGFDGYPGTFTMAFRLKAILAGLFKPETEILLPYTNDMISRDEGVKEYISSDPDRRLDVPARMLIELLKLTFKVTREPQADCPVLMMTSGHDRIVDNQISTRFFERLRCPSKDRRHFAEAWHDLMFDPVIDRVVEEVLSWMSERQPERLLAG